MERTPSSGWTRREILAAGAVAGAGLLLPRRELLARMVPERREPKRSLRIAHLTDPHIMPEKHADEGVASCLTHAQSLADKPGLILTGGDHVYDSMEVGAPRTKVQWDLWKKSFADHCNIPVRSCIGNHDIWGLNKKESKTTGDEPLYGKKMAVEMLGIPKQYYSFDQSGWHFVVLDSVTPVGDGYVGKLDDEQHEWLAGDLAGVKPGTPTLVLTHVPVIAACALWQAAKSNNGGDFKVGASKLLTDGRRVMSLFEKYPTVKLCISGHLHMVDRVELNGVAYLCNGAVSGNWWKGRHENADEGYAVIDLFDDGTFKSEYTTYGWKAEKEVPKNK